MRNRAVFVQLLAAIAATIFFFHRAVLSDGIFITRDIQRVYCPLKQFWVARVTAGQLPEWYPYDGLGQSYIGMVISGVFHPLNLLYLPLSLEPALKVSVLLAVFAAFAGANALARRFAVGPARAFLAGLIFALNGYLVGVTNNLLYLIGAATIPGRVGRPIARSRLRRSAASGPRLGC